MLGDNEAGDEILFGDDRAGAGKCLRMMKVKIGNYLEMARVKNCWVMKVGMQNGLKGIKPRMGDCLGMMKLGIQFVMYCRRGQQLAQRTPKHKQRVGNETGDVIPVPACAGDVLGGGGSCIADNMWEQGWGQDWGYNKRAGGCAWVYLR